MYLILMVYACLISCSLIKKSKCNSLAYFNLRWTCVIILHKDIYVYIYKLFQMCSIQIDLGACLNRFLLI